jgi:hypothetical protein
MEIPEVWICGCIYSKGEIHTGPQSHSGPRDTYLYRNSPNVDWSSKRTVLEVEGMSQARTCLLPWGAELQGLRPPEETSHPATFSASA